MLLIVDDDGELRQTLAEFLTAQGYSVKCAANGSEAMQLVQSLNKLPDLILLDLMMPILDGWGFLIQRCKSARLAKVPVVMMTGSGGIDQLARLAGATTVIHKPVPPDRLLQVIRHFVGSA